MAVTKPRGPYRKSDERRTEILRAALEAYATSDAGGPTLKAIADKVGLTESALLYHFGSREELFWAIVKARDESDSFQAEGQDVTATDFARLGQIISHNASTPGLVKLFLEQAVAAVNPSHPAHSDVRARYERLNAGLAQGLAGPKGLPQDQVDWLARIIIAASDGLQIQWLLDPSIDMRSDLEALMSLVTQASEKDPNH